MADISEGKKILEIFFGAMVKPIFTPPWNRCSQDTADVLSALGFQMLSRESEAKPLRLNGLTEIPVAVDWFAKRKGIYLSKTEIGAIIAEKIAGGEPFGIMLHHAEMDAEEKRVFEELCRVLSEFRRVKFVSKSDLYAEKRKRAAARPA